MGGIWKAIREANKTRRAAKEAEKLYQSSANVADRARKAGDLTKASAEVKGAKKFAGKKGFKRGLAVGAGGVLAGQYAANKKVTVTVSDRKKPAAPKKKVVKKKKLPKGTQRYSF